MINQMNPYTGMFNQRPTNNSINWVQGLEGAKAYTLSPRENVVLMDSEVNDIFYIKVCDDIGRCTLRKFRYTEDTTTESFSGIDLSDYVKKSELESMLNKMLGGGVDESTLSATKST